jgi:glutamate/aspartate transport system substrate-binding protein
MHRHMPFFFRTLLAVGLVWLASISYAADTLTGTLKAIKDRKAVLIGYLKDAYPMSSLGADGKPAGYSIDLCRVIAEQAGKAVGLDPVDIQYVPITLDGRIDAITSGKIDIECGSSTITLSRMQKVDFTNMTFLSGGSLLVKKGSAIRSVAGLVDETVAVIPGTTTEKSLRDALAKTYVKAKVIEVPDHAAGMAALDSGKATAYASDRVLLIGLLVGSKTPDAYELAAEQFSYEPYGFMVRRNDADFRLVANRTLAGIYRSADIVPIFERWFGTLGKPTPALLGMYLMNATPE